MQRHRSGQTAGLSHKPLQPRSTCEMLPFHLRRLYLAHRMWFGIEMTVVHVCTSGREMPNAQRGSYRVYLSEDVVLRCPQHLRQDQASAMIHGRPAPAWWRFLPNNTPHFIDFRFCHLVDLHADRVWLQVLDGPMVDGLQRRRLFVTRPSRGGLLCSTRARSRRPLPFKVMSRSCCLTSGKRP
jgi:hypothetical protein